MAKSASNKAKKIKDVTKGIVQLNKSLISSATALDSCISSINTYYAALKSSGENLTKQ